MAYIKTYKGARLDLEFYKNRASLDYPVEVYNDDETEFDVSIYDDIKLEIAHKIHGTIVLTLTLLDGSLYLYSPADNFVIINLPDIDLRPKEYWYECWGDRNADGARELVFFGVGKVL